MTGVRATIAIAAMTTSVVLIVAGLFAASAARRQGRNDSFIPFVPALLGVAGCIVAPWRGTAWFALVFLIADPSVGLFVLALLRGNFRK